MDELLQLTNYYIVDPYILRVDPNLAASLPFDNVCHWSSGYSLVRQFFVLWGFIYITSLILYFLFATLTYRLYFLPSNQIIYNPKINPDNNSAYWKYDRSQVYFEIFTSVWSLLLMSAMTVPMELLSMCGYSKVYFNISDYGLGYLLLSPILFLIFTDSLIYFIHLGLHWGPLYSLHKLHHKYKETTPFSAFSFHPIDGFAQSFPYHLFVFIFPMHNYLYAFALLIVGLWTINIHDRVTLRLFGVNGAAHHTIHHTKFNYNYGQYFTFWDQLMGTYKDPYVLEPYNINNSDAFIHPASQSQTQTQKKTD